MVFKVLPDQIKNFINKNNYDGYNVTIPHKNNIIKNLKYLDDYAQEITAVNCVYNSKGYNTDWIGFLHALRHMGANIELQNEIDSFEPTADILVRTSSLKGITLNTNLVANMIDEMPAFFIAASLAEGITKVKGAKKLRTKESDRLQVMSEVLDSFGLKTSTVRIL